MTIVDGEEHLTLRDLAEMWGYSSYHRLSNRMGHSKTYEYDYPEPDVKGRPGVPSLWKKSRLHELNDWHNKYLRIHAVRGK